MHHSEEKVKVYEKVFHDVQLLNIAMNNEKLQKLISIICDWSYAHRCGNGMLNEEEQNALIEHEFNKLKDREYMK